MQKNKKRALLLKKILPIFVSDLRKTPDNRQLGPSGIKHHETLIPFSRCEIKDNISDRRLFINGKSLIFVMVKVVSKGTHGREN